MHAKIKLALILRTKMQIFLSFLEVIYYNLRQKRMLVLNLIVKSYVSAVDRHNLGDCGSSKLDLSLSVCLSICVSVCPAFTACISCTMCRNSMKLLVGMFKLRSN